MHLIGGRAKILGKRRYERPAKVFLLPLVSLGESRLISRRGEELFGAYGGAADAHQRCIYVIKQVRKVFSLVRARDIHTLLSRVLSD